VDPYEFSVAGLPPAHPAPPPAAAAAASGGKAAWGYRIAAGLVDVMLSIAIGGVFDAAGHSSSAAETNAGLAMFASYWLNIGVLAGLTGGRSAGKLVVGTRVVRASGARFGVGMALLRDVLLRTLFAIPPLFLVDALLPLRADRRSLRDRIVGTDVVHAAEAVRPALAAVLATVVAVALAGLSLARTDAFHEDFSDYTRQQYIADCSEYGTAERTCACGYAHVKARLTYDEYAEARDVDPEDLPPRIAEVLDDALEDCPR
jgi:uncharacterized RDD family membrane protein YckC